jgi:hypothetical protein
MKVLDKDRHNLSNVEVLDWIQRNNDRFERQGRQGRLPENYIRITKQVSAAPCQPLAGLIGTSQIKEHLERKDGPLEDTEQNVKNRHKPATLELARKLKAQPYSLFKGEILMILNHRPRSRDVLATLIEESDSRFPEDGGLLDQILALVHEHIGPVDDPDELQRLKAQFEREKQSTTHKAKALPKHEVTTTGANKRRDRDMLPLKSLTVTEAAALPTEDEMDTDYDNEEAALWALMRKEAQANMEGEEDIEDSPLTKYMNDLKLRQTQQRQR